VHPSLEEEGTENAEAIAFEGDAASRAAEKSVLLKGTASAVPQIFCLQWGFSP
jgi:hypothetical protein